LSGAVKVASPPGPTVTSVCVPWIVTVCGVVSSFWTVTLDPLLTVNAENANPEMVSVEALLFGAGLVGALLVGVEVVGVGVGEVTAEPPYPAPVGVVDEDPEHAAVDSTAAVATIRAAAWRGLIPGRTLRSTTRFSVFWLRWSLVR
jgi:hypothetical protein